MMSQPSVANKELVFSYECQTPILVPVSYDSTNRILEVVDCPSTVSDSAATHATVVPLNGATSGLPNRHFNVIRIDSTHVQIANNDTFSLGGTLDFDNFLVAIRENYLSQDSLGQLLSTAGDYEIEVSGYVQTSEKTVFRFTIGGWQGVNAITANQYSNLPSGYTSILNKSVLNIDLSNKTIVVKSSDVDAFTLGGNRATYYSEHFDDEKTVTFSANPNRFAIGAYISSGTTIKIYKIL